MPGERHRTQRIGTEDVSLLADQRMAAQSCLDPDLVPLSCLQSNLHERGIAKTLEHAVLADRLHSLRIARVRPLLDHCLAIPHEMIAPRALRRIGMAVHDRPVLPFGLTT